MRDRHSISATLLAIAAAYPLVCRTGRGAGSHQFAPSPIAENAVGRAGPAGHLDRRIRHAAAAPAKYANQEFFTEAQRAELDKRANRSLRDRRATDRDYSPAPITSRCSSRRSTPGRARRGSSIRPMAGIPPLTPAAQKAAAADREYRLALLRATDTCKKRAAAVRRRQVRSAALAATCRTAAALHRRRSHQSLRRSGGRLACRTAA